MDEMTQLALMAKAKKVFGNNSTFLSFPVTPLQFTHQELSFVSEMNLQNLKAFSLLVNHIPKGEAWSPTDDRYLWDVYQNVLQGIDTELASSARTEQEESQYQQAIQFLRIETEDGLWEDSDAVKRYKEYRDQWFVLQETYAAAKSTGETTQDPEVKKHWKESEEPRLRQEISHLENRWINEGFRQEVEQAQSTKARLGAKSPSTTWEQWTHRFNADLDTLTDTDNVQFYPSSFSPINAIDEGAWQTFSMGKHEIQALLEKAPTTVKSKLSSKGKSSDIVSISFEFSSATILRNWCDRDLFEARFWRFSDANKQLSNGQVPPTGLCPAYVTAVVFARNISITTAVKPQETQGTPKKTILQKPVLRFPSAVQLTGLQPKVQHLAQPLVPSIRTTDSPSAASTVSPRAIRATIDGNSPAILRPSGSRPVIRKPNRPIQTKPISTPAKVSQAFIRLQASAIVRPQLSEFSGPVIRPRPKPPQTPETVSETVTDPDQIFMLALVCTRLPTCPNPDPSMQW